MRRGTVVGTIASLMVAGAASLGGVGAGTADAATPQPAPPRWSMKVVPVEGWSYSRDVSSKGEVLVNTDRTTPGGIWAGTSVTWLTSEGRQDRFDGALGLNASRDVIGGVVADNVNDWQGVSWPRAGIRTEISKDFAPTDVNDRRHVLLRTGWETTGFIVTTIAGKQLWTWPEPEPDTFSTVPVMMDDADEVVANRALIRNADTPPQVNALLVSRRRGATPLGCLTTDPQCDSWVTAISGDGRYIVGASGTMSTRDGTPRTPVFFGRDGSVVPYASGRRFESLAVNNRGWVLGRLYTTTRVWRDGELIDLAEATRLPQGWALLDASAINDRGQISATVRDGAGVNRAALLTPRR